MSPENTLNGFSGVTLIDAERNQYRRNEVSYPQPFKSLAVEDVWNRVQLRDQAEYPRCITTRMSHRVGIHA
jgi:hypothetical protein